MRRLERETRSILRILVVFASLAASGLEGAPSPPPGAARSRPHAVEPLPGASQRARVVGVTDGDTIVVALPAGRRSVRLIGVDTPEAGHGGSPGEYLSADATAFVRRLALNRIVTLSNDPGREDQDSYGRLLRYVELPDGRLLNADIIREGYAFAYTRFPFSRARQFRDLEHQARAAGRGLWAKRSIPELEWTLAQGEKGFTVYPMTNRSWAVRCGAYVKLHVRGSDLASTLEELRHWRREGGADHLDRRLVTNGWVRLAEAR